MSSHFNQKTKKSEDKKMLVILCVYICLLCLLYIYIYLIYKKYVYDL
jgi:hypothetical protein